MTYESYDRRAERPLIGLALLFLLVLAVPIIDPKMNGAGLTILHVADVTIWALFATDYCTRLAIVEDRRRFVRTHLVDLAAVALPALRPLRLLRLFSVGNMLATKSRRSLIAQAGRLVTTSAAILIFVASVAVLDVERNAKGANITTFGDALWWAATTITTVGYGDRFPVTTEGRLVAVTLMGLGIALVGVLTASIAAWFVREVRATEQEAVEPLEAQVARLEVKVDQLTSLLSGRLPAV